MLDRSLFTLAVLAILLFLVIQPTQGTGENSRVPLSPSSRREVPDDEYVPVPREKQRTSPAYQYTSDRFFATQVNVNSSGENIEDDAANEPSIAIDPTDPNKMVIGWRQFDTISSNFRQAGYGYTTDAGKTWSFPGVIEPGVFRSDPVLNFDSDGVFYYNSLTASGDDFWCNVYRSTNGGATWDSGVYAQGGDKQWMTIDRSGGIGNGNIYAYWTDSWSICYPEFFTRSTDGGDSYEDCVSILDDPYWGTLTVSPDGELYVCGNEFYVIKSTLAQVSGIPVEWDFSTEVSLDGGYNMGGPNPDGLLGQSWVATDHTTGPTRGYVYLLCSVFRYSNPDPLDVMFSRSTNGGLTWSNPVRVNDDSTNTAYQWFGTMSVSPDGRINVIWLDTRNDPGGYDSELYYSYSEDQGFTWSTNERLSDSFDPHVGWPQQNKMGDYFDMVSDETGSHLAWAGTFNGEQDVYYGFISSDIYVPNDFGTIQEAINAAVDGKTIVVTPGTYYEHDIDFLGKAITVRSMDPGDSAVVATTIIDADSLGCVFIFDSGEDSTSVLMGLTITGGASDSAGGILCSGSSPTISGNIIYGNSGVLGGGISCMDGAVPIVANNVITGNIAEYGGGAAFWNTSAEIVNITISGNQAQHGGGIHLGLCADLTVTNTIIWDNEAMDANQITVGGDSCEATLSLSYSDVERGQASVWVAPDCILNWGEGMIDADPLFRNIGGADYHLMTSLCGDSVESPCIDTGDPTIADSLLDCYWGLGTLSSDMGAYGGGEQQVGLEDEFGKPVIPRAFALSQNYPNPFNPSTTISFEIPGSSSIKQRVILTVYDVRGRRVKTLVDSDLDSGSHRIHWDGRSDRGESVASGIYLYTLKTGGEIFIRKMTILK
jgi:hypothetical protein